MFLVVESNIIYCDLDYIRKYTHLIIYNKQPYFFMPVYIQLINKYMKLINNKIDAYHELNDSNVIEDIKQKIPGVDWTSVSLIEKWQTLSNDIPIASIRRVFKANMIDSRMQEFDYYGYVTYIYNCDSPVHWNLNQMFIIQKLKR